MILMLVVFPFYFEEGYAHIGTDKSVFYRQIGSSTAKILAAPALLCLYMSIEIYLGKKKKRKIREIIAANPTDIFAAIYAAALLLSYSCSKYKGTALWGIDRWYMGLIPQLMAVAVYFMISKCWRPRRQMFYLMFGASAAVFLLGILNRFNIYPIKMAYANPSYISTIGNINWYCGYVVSVFFAGAALFWIGESGKVWQRILLMAYTALGFAALVTQGSDSGMVALAVVILTMFCMSVGAEKRMLAFWQEMVLLWGGCTAVFLLRLLASDGGSIGWVGLGEKLTYGWIPVIMTLLSAAFLVWVWLGEKKGTYRKKFFQILARVGVWGSLSVCGLVLLLAAVNTLRPGSLGRLSEYSLFTFNADWGSSRGATWSAGFRCFAEQDMLHRLVGTGPDCMAEFIDNEASEQLQLYIQERFAGNRLTNAHNEWLTVLVDTGILGLIGFAGMMISGMRELLKKGREKTYACICGFCLLAYTANNVFSFQQSMSLGTIFVIFGMGMAFMRENENSGKRRIRVR